MQVEYTAFQGADGAFLEAEQPGASLVRYVPILTDRRL